MGGKGGENKLRPQVALEPRLAARERRCSQEVSRAARPLLSSSGGESRSHPNRAGYGRGGTAIRVAIFITLPIMPPPAWACQEVSFQNRNLVFAKDPIRSTSSPQAKKRWLGSTWSDGRVQVGSSRVLRIDVQTKKGDRVAAADFFDETRPRCGGGAGDAR